MLTRFKARFDGTPGNTYEHDFTTVTVFLWNFLKLADIGLMLRGGLSEEAYYS